MNKYTIKDLSMNLTLIASIIEMHYLYTAVDLNV